MRFSRRTTAKVTRESQTATHGLGLEFKEGCSFPGCRNVGPQPACEHHWNRRSGVTNLETSSRVVLRFYNNRGTAEQWINEGKQAVKMTRFSCYRFRANEVRLAQSLLAYNLGNLRIADR